MREKNMAMTVVWALGACGIAAYLTGCGIVSGEMYVGTRRIDVYQASQKMYRKPTPWKCYFVNCPEFTDHVDENQGS